MIEALNEDQHEIVETAAEVLYGLIHARFILTTAGMNKMVSLRYIFYQNLENTPLLLHLFVNSK